MRPTKDVMAEVAVLAACKAARANERARILALLDDEALAERVCSGPGADSYTRRVEHETVNGYRAAFRAAIKKED